MDNCTARSNLNCNYNFIKNIVYYNCKILSQSLPLTWGTGPRSLRHFLLIFTSREARGKDKPKMPHLFAEVLVAVPAPCITTHCITHIVSQRIVSHALYHTHCITRIVSHTHCITTHCITNIKIVIQF